MAHDIVNKSGDQGVKYEKSDDRSDDRTIKIRKM